MTNPATVPDLESGFYRPLTDHEQNIAQTWLDRAWRYLLRHRRTLEADLAASLVSEDDVIDVLCVMAGRVISNPEAKRAEAIDDYSYTRDSAVSAGFLYATDDELGGITPAGLGRRNSIRLTSALTS